MKDNKNPFQKEEETKEQQETQAEEKEQEELEEETKIEEESSEEKEEEKKDDFEEKYEELNNKYLRLAADFDNFRKRTAQEKEDLAKYAASELLKKLTSVLDTFERAQEHLKNIDNCQTVKDSYEVAHKQLVETLKKCGLEEIEAMGKEFNPNEHEAISQVESEELEPDTIAFVAQKGYKMGDRIIRPALVGVAKKKEDE